MFTYYVAHRRDRRCFCLLNTFLFLLRFILLFHSCSILSGGTRPGAVILR